MIVSREWLDQVSDDKGLTRGQQQLLSMHCGFPFVGKLLNEDIARHVAICKGWRKTRGEVLLMSQFNGA